MTLISELEKGRVKVIHHSTSSLFELFVGNNSVFLEYTDIDDLQEIINKIKETSFKQP